VALDAKTIISGYGGVVIGPFPRVPVALEAARNAAIDMALLDINVAGTPSFVVADALRERNIPFVFCTGYGREIVPPRFNDVGVVDKPFVKQTLLVALLAAVAAKGGRSEDEPTEAEMTTAPPGAPIRNPS
jgi:CheY-like chemotaxis protein